MNYSIKSKWIKFSYFDDNAALIEDCAIVQVIVILGLKKKWKIPSTMKSLVKLEINNNSAFTNLAVCVQVWEN